MAAEIIPLVEVFVEIADFRQASGKRYPLPAVLALASAAMLCGYRSYGAIAEWGRNYGRELVTALGFLQGKTPCASALHWIFRHLDCLQFESQLGQWAESVLQAYPPSTGQAEGLAIDGKTLRGSQKQGAPGSHLLSALSHRLGITLAQQAVTDKSNELFQIEDLLETLVLKGRIVTLDALHTQRYVAQTILDGDGDYMMVVKDNQPQMRADIQWLFQERQVVAETLAATETIDLGHGRIEVRRLTASSALADYLDWPGLQQVFEIVRTTTCKHTGQARCQTVYGITSLSPQRADAPRLLSLARQHWRIENKAHWVRDVTYDEDRSQVRCGSIPQIMAALRNLVIGLMRTAGETNIAAAGRRFAAQPWAALALIGIPARIE
jgi:predicted transposase YbfD/YdcC